MVSNDQEPATSTVWDYKSLTVWVIGILVAMTGQYTCWITAMKGGFGSSLLLFSVVSTAFGVYASSAGELTSAMPFDGGAFGLARCTLNYYLGFLVGCCEVLESVFYSSSSLLLLGRILSEIFPGCGSYQPLLWLGFYFIILPFHIKGKLYFWEIGSLLAVSSILLLLVFCFGSIPFLHKHSSAKVEYFHGGFPQAFMILPHITKNFIGVDCINVCCDEVQSPRKNIPRNLLMCITILSVTGLFALTVFAALPNQNQTIDGLPVLDSGFSLIFKIPKNLAAVISIPAIFGTAFGFIFCHGKVISGMAASNLLPPMLCKKWPNENGTPYLALLAGSLMGYIVCLVAYFVPAFGKVVVNVALLAAYTVYLAQCLGFVQAKRAFKNLPRDFVSPFGIFGGLYAGTIFLACFVSVVAFQDDSHLAIVVFAGIILVLSGYYLFIAKAKQNLSDEESKVLYVAHIVKFNISKTTATTTGNKVRMWPRRTSISYVDNSNALSSTGERGTGRIGSGTSASTGKNNRRVFIDIEHMPPMVEMDNLEDMRAHGSGVDGGSSWNIFSGDSSSSEGGDGDADAEFVAFVAEVELGLDTGAIAVAAAPSSPKADHLSNRRPTRSHEELQISVDASAHGTGGPLHSGAVSLGDAGGPRESSSCLVPAQGEVSLESSAKEQTSHLDESSVPQVDSSPSALSPQGPSNEAVARNWTVSRSVEI